ncbi:2-methylcitrate dehydratase PrpD [Shimia isoporae]|uniref:2-methylcitrate dehydratase PrpD n=1 Tax=Shimia isoporae TaxID=647720 RepID=A0A4R1NVL3_9RHOB|nr:MmgE/PrpD family protein [Shimia isoporae]TCL09318.1 2-methylcitrate dehydratase PrpD [Shimia isoporae]
MITEKLAAFVAETPADAVPEDTKHMVRLSMLDWAACGIAGIEEPVACACRSLASEEGGAPQASMFGGGKAPARTAALVNGVTSHALDYDDTHFAHIGHPSVAVFPAALAIAERQGESGEALQHAALLGIETSIRIGVWLGRGHYQCGFHQTGTAGAFGATAAAARLLGLDSTQVETALGLVATRASGSKAQFGTMGKPFNAGIAASNGVEAALLVANGMSGNPAGLEAAQGFGPTHHGEADAGALDGLGADWLMDTISHKFHACCHGLHATLEALAGINRPAASDVVAVKVTTHPRWMSVCNQPEPTEGLGAKFSYRVVVAMALLGHDTAALSNYSDALCADCEVVALRDRVTVAEDASLSEMQARVSLTLTDGTTIEAFHDLDAPIALMDREARLRAKAQALVGADKAQGLWRCINAPESSAQFGALI